MENFGRQSQRRAGFRVMNNCVGDGIVSFVATGDRGALVGGRYHPGRDCISSPYRGEVEDGSLTGEFVRAIVMFVY